MKIVIDERGIIQVNDNSDGGKHTVHVHLPIVLHRALQQTSGSMFYTQNLSGSMTRLQDGTSYIIAGPGISITTGSKGQVYVESTAVESLARVWREVPSGSTNGTNPTFTLAHNPDPPESLMVFKNGLCLSPGTSNDYTLSGQTITFMPGAIPLSGSNLFVNYVR